MKCINCGSEVEQTAKTCPVCKSGINENRWIGNVRKEVNTDMRKRVIGIALLCFLALLILAGMFVLK